MLRRGRLLRALGIGLILALRLYAQAHAQAPLASPQSTDAAAARAVVEKYSALFAAKDLAGALSLWSLSSPEFDSQRKSLGEIFARGQQISLNGFVVRRVMINGDTARVRVEAEFEVIQTSVGKPSPAPEKRLKTFLCSRIDGAWKIIRELATHDDLADAFVNATSDEERSALLEADPELVTAGLSLAVGRISERLRHEKQYGRALDAAKLAIRLADRVNDRSASGLAREQAGRACAGLLDYRQAAGYFEQGELLFEQAGDKQLASRLLGRAASCHYFLEEYRASIDLNLKRLRLKEELNDRESLASTLDDLTLSYYYLGDFHVAADTGRRAITVYEELHDDGGLARLLIIFGGIQLAQNDYEQAIASYERAGSIFAKNGDVIGPALATLNIGEVYATRGDYERALDFYHRALKVFTDRKSPARIALALQQIGMVHSVLGDYDKAREYFDRSLQLYEDARRPLGRAEVIGAMGELYRRQGNYARALDYQRQSLKLLEESGRKYGLADSLTAMGDLYLLQGDEDLAEAFYSQSQTLFEYLGSKEKLAALVNRRAALLQQRGDNRESLAAYHQSLDLYRMNGNRAAAAETLRAIGESYLLSRQFDRAQASYSESQTLFEQIRDKSGIASAMMGLARVKQAQGNHSGAISIAESARALADRTGNLESLWELDNIIGESELALRQTEQARLTFEKAVSVVELMRAQAAGGELARRHFLEHRLEPYRSLVGLFAGEARPSAALIWAERSKARVLSDVLHGGRVDARRAMTAAERREDLHLRTRIVSLNTQLTRAGAPGVAAAPGIDELKTLREKARVNYEVFQHSLYSAHPELRMQRGDAPVINEDEIAKILPDPNSALLEYVVAEDVTYLFTVTRSVERNAVEIRVFRLQIKREELAKEIEAFRQQLNGRDLGFRQSAMKLYSMLLEPAQAQLKGKTNLIIVPDDKLWELPFQALVTGANRFLIEETAVAYAPSLTVLREMRNRPQNPGAQSNMLLALGNPQLGKDVVDRANPGVRHDKLNPLPEAEQEVKALGQLYGAATSKVYVGAEAREDRAKTEAPNARILHFATHGTLNNASPMYSSLVLTPKENDEDGLLEAREIMQLDLKAELAVLSACETARGRFGAGEGMIGLTWALFVAGVPTTVVSQWKVEAASTRDLMIEFYRALNSRQSAPKALITKSEALRRAALKLLKNPETSHPFYWAGFVLVGDGT